MSHQPVILSRVNPFMIAIRAAKNYTPLICIEPGILLIDRGGIKDVISDQGQELAGMEVIDASAHILAPGLIDLHTHGMAAMKRWAAIPRVLSEWRRAMPVMGLRVSWRPSAG
jgi:imidazolonepropionase-like amidohydrolase